MELFENWLILEVVVNFLLETSDRISSQKRIEHTNNGLLI